MTNPRRTAGTAALLLACALGATACGSSAPPAPAPAPASTGPTATGPETNTVFTTDRPLDSEALTRAAEQLRHRAELLGLPNPRVKPGDGTLTLTTAGPVADRLAALTHRAALEIRPVLAAVVDATPAPADAPDRWRDRLAALDCAAPAAQAQAAPGTELLACDRADPSGIRSKLALGPIAVQGAEIADSSAAADTNGAGWQVQVHFTPAGGAAFADLTGRIAQLQEPENQLAILVDGYVLSHPFVVEAITGGRAAITGAFTKEQAEELAAQLATQALPADLHPVGATP
ncbi:SecDF P1 head subdomain-containing protein [Kitasatospora sp. NPDC004272]